MNCHILRNMTQWTDRVLNPTRSVCSTPRSPRIFAIHFTIPQYNGHSPSRLPLGAPPAPSDSWPHCPLLCLAHLESEHSHHDPSALEIVAWPPEVLKKLELRHQHGRACGDIDAGTKRCGQLANISLVTAVLPSLFALIFYLKNFLF
jgi:hypothetical protein